jgi:putative component of toxin-antitoxin plasmid stabilization module
MEILQLIGITAVVLALAFSGIGIKMFFKKDGRFVKESCCSVDKSQSPVVHVV